MGVIVTLLPNADRLQRLRAAVRDRHAIEPCESWPAVTRVCASAPVHLAVLDFYADGAANFERIRLLRARFPRTALVAYVAASRERAHERLTPEGLARLLMVPRRVLARRLEDGGFPPPHRLVTWGRLIVAAHMMEDADRSADGVAHALAFPSGSAFRNTCQRYVRATPQQIRARGGAEHVTRAFVAGLRTPAPRAVREAERQAVVALTEAGVHVAEALL